MSTDDTDTKPQEKRSPKGNAEKKLKKGEIIAFQRGKVTVMKWMDKEKVSLLSTIHNTEMEQIQVRSENERKLKIVMDYNNTMGGVDRMDQNLKSFEIIKKRGKKCYRKIFFHIFDIAVWNSYVATVKTEEKHELEFRLDLIDCVIEKKHSGLNFHPGGDQVEPNPLRLTKDTFGNNYPTDKKTDRKTTQSALKRNENGKRILKETRFFCPDCDVGLCITPCFKLFHTQKDF
ncbi:piggyBac transposable element-derived protein 4 [Trichonephila inaurata madagascariensis]|uniref:PiggyBac transposable element-derived protein 4 n=1 Tax=Trichonephila inaurata madagascariensis TaxID=2747483 RepID=A0A8X7CMG7_9ARAC|nr:piggyBac transposable element-derived protein 4 [Trichonephila inaurata madagascariensis]